MSTVLDAVGRRLTVVISVLLMTGSIATPVPGLDVTSAAGGGDRPVTAEGGAGAEIANAGSTGGTAARPALETDAAEHPWAVLLTTANGVPFCAGTLVARTSVLTAAACVWGADPERLRVVTTGGAPPDVAEQGVRAAEVWTHPEHVTEVWTHPEHVPESPEHDIAVVTLAEPIDGTVLRLGGTDDAALYEPGRSVRLIIDGESRQGALRIEAADACTAVYDFYDPAWMLCAAADSADADPCLSEIGGPLFASDGDSEVLVGLLPSGPGCGAAGMPGAFPNVAAYADLLAEEIHSAEPRAPVPTPAEQAIEPDGADSAVAGGRPAAADPGAAPIPTDPFEAGPVG
ncbi:secreted trypsin-like serine protease [Actinoalloteichus hoggarensis]|uniref:Trypsin n=1 Tax=Actinoalloteichus hoggarensis TaxID=1470176 RepID=A0A221W0T7_9PSEU|nr:trypsin-like serine protease [Actinoalloteichus hoggarensis]ASO19362.1 Trypsin [Actinoalloteichus hoggarensis]MBB5920600.1 secreted trypsin-like serine protease [Actinoalloteichus hoggarensis]